MRSVLWVNFEISKFLNNARLPIAENQTRQSSGNKIQCMFGINFDFFFHICNFFFTKLSLRELHRILREPSRWLID